jgi:hypothetical protein
VFAFSVVGFPVAVFIFFIMSAFILVGHASLGIMLSGLLADSRINKTNYLNQYFYQLVFFCVFTIEIFKYIPYNIGWVYQYLILPVFELVAAAAGFSNGFLKKKFYPVPPDCEPGRKQTDIRRVLFQYIKDNDEL